MFARTLFDETTNDYNNNGRRVYDASDMRQIATNNSQFPSNRARNERKMTCVTEFVGRRRKVILYDGENTGGRLFAFRLQGPEARIERGKWPINMPGKRRIGGETVKPERRSFKI